MSCSLSFEHIMWMGWFWMMEEEPWGSSPPHCPPTFKPRARCPQCGGTQEGSRRVCMTQSWGEGQSVETGVQGETGDTHQTSRDPGESA